jgi:recombination protein RecA
MGAAPSLLQFPRARVASRESRAPAWDLPELAGRLVEISAAAAGAGLTVATGLVLDAQRRGEAAAWVALPGGTFHPPDVAAAGVDLAALAVVRVPDVTSAALAADELLRCDAFGVVVLDLEDARPEVPAAAQSRLAALALKHDAAVVVLTRKEGADPSLGSLVSLRAEARRAGPGGPSRGFGRDPACEVAVLKDKRRGPGRTHREACHGPPGVR